MPEPIAWLRVLEDGTLQSKRAGGVWQRCKPDALPAFREALAGRCETCRWWKEPPVFDLAEDAGICGRISNTRDLGMPAVAIDRLVCRADFGCVQWEAGDE